MTSARLEDFHNGETTSDKDLLQLLIQYPGVVRDAKLEHLGRLLGNYDNWAEMLKGEGVFNFEVLKRMLLGQLQRIHHIHCMGNSEFYESFLYDLEKNSLLREGFRDRKVVELGPERKPVYVHLAQLGIADYTAVEPFYADETREALRGHIGQINVVQVDGLSYLLTQPNDSCVVVSFGVLPYCSEPYNKSIAKEIFRTTVPGGISIHDLNGDSIKRYHYSKAGFRPIEDIVKGLDTLCDVFVKPSH